jgi:anti-anti-sigma regulatory factor
MKRCPYCGESVSDDAQRCENCGGTLSDSSTPASQATGRPTVLPTSLKVETQKIEGKPSITVLVLSGNIDVPGARTFQNTLRRFTVDSTPRVLMDFAAVPAVCSAGYSALIGWARERESDAPNSLAVIGMNEKIMQELGTMGIAACLPIFDDRESALAALTSAE